MRPILVVGVDPSSKKLAALITRDGDLEIDMRTIVLGSNNSPKANASAYDFIEEIRTDYVDADIRMFVEQPIIMKLAMNGVIPQSKASGAIEASAHHNNIRVVKVAVTSWKKSVVGKGNASKDEVQAWCKMHWRAAYDLSKGPRGGVDQDCIDASAIAMYGLQVTRRENALLNKMQKASTK